MADGIRADAQRNRARIVESAAQAFENAEGAVSLEAIARAAGVGIGTLYRHFPTREVLVEAVYRAELAEVAASASALLQDHPPVGALRLWMDRYAQFVAAKRGMAESLLAIFETGAVARNDTRAAIVGAVAALLAAGVDDGTLRSDVEADDVVTGLLGTMLASRSTEQARRMFDLLLAGLVADRRES